MGSGPAVILVTGAMMTRSMFNELAGMLAADFTVFNYDRRGRGESNDTKPFELAREIEDLEALIDEAGSSVCVYGISSGACLAIEAASVLGDKITKLALYEAPYDDRDGAAEGWREYRAELDRCVAADRNGDAVVLFMKLVGAQDKAVADMKASPMWPAMETVAPTLPYDAAAMGDDRSVPVSRAAKIKAHALIMDGAMSKVYMPFMRESADKLAKAIPNAKRRTLEGQSHDVSTQVIAPVLAEFFSA